MPPDAKQRALSALWRLLMTLGMFGVGYILGNAQDGTYPTILVTSTWFLCCHLVSFPTSPLAAALVRSFDQLDDDGVKYLVIVFAGFLLLHLCQGQPVGMVYVLALGIVRFCTTQLAISRAAMEPAPLLSCEAPQPDAADTEADDPDDTATDTDPDASLGTEAEPSGDSDQSAEPEKPVEPEQMDSDESCHGPPALDVIPYGPSVRKVFEPQPQVSGAKPSLWAFLLAILTLGSAVLLAHALIDWSVRDWVFSPAPVDIAPLFEAEVIFQANKTELPIQVPHADFIPTDTLGSPCYPAPTPTPVDRSMMWRRITIATPMPTPMPAPTPAAMPQPAAEAELPAAPDKPMDVLKRLFDYDDIPDPKPLLKWYFGLPQNSQYTVIVIAMLVLLCLAEPLVTLAAHLVVLTIAYLASAAVLALLLMYGFTPETSLAIVVPADFAFIVGIWWAESWLKNLASTSWSNAAGLAKLRNDLESSRARSEGRIDRADSWITVLKDVLKNFANAVSHHTHVLYIQYDILEKHGAQITSLVLDKARQVDLDEITRIIDELSGKIGGLETSDDDATVLPTLQRTMDELRLMAENLEAQNADANELERVREELKRMTRRVDELQNKKADAEALKELAGRLDRQAESLANVVDAQEKLTTRVAGQGSEIDGVRQEVSSLTQISDRHSKSITSLVNDHGSQIARERKRINKLEEEKKILKGENAELRRDVDNLKSSATVLLQKMEDMEARMVDQEDLKQLRHDVASDADQKISQQVGPLRSEIESKHKEAMQAHRDLEDRVGKQVDDSKKAAEAFEKACRSRLDEEGEAMDKRFDKRAEIIDKDIKTLNASVKKGFDDTFKSINDADKRASSALQRVEAVESQQVGSNPRLDVADEIRLKVDECMEKFMVSDKFRAAVSDAHQLTKKQSQRERLRAQIREDAEEYLHSTEVQEKIVANIMERQARDTNNPPGDPPGVIPAGRATSPSTDSSNSHAARDNTTGNDDPAGDPPGVISGGQATVPGGKSSDNTSTATIPEEPTNTDDVEAHHGARGVPLGDPLGLNTGGDSLSPDGTTSAGPSGDGDCTGPRSSSEDNDGTLQPKRQEVEEPAESSNSTDAQASGQADSDETDERLLGDFIGHKLARDGTEGKKKTRRRTRKQIAMSKQRAKQANEQGEVTEKKEQDEDIDEEEEDADDGADDDEYHDNDPRGPPPGSGGSNGHDGTGGNDDDDQDGNDGGAPPPPRRTYGLANSRFASPSFSGNSTHHGQERNPREDGEAHSDNDEDDQAGDDGGAPRPPSQTHGLANSIFASPSLSGSGSPHGIDTTGGGDVAEANAANGAEAIPEFPSNSVIRAAKNWLNKETPALATALDHLEKERQQGQNGATHAQRQSTEAQAKSKMKRKTLKSAEKHGKEILKLLKQERDRQEHEDVQPEQADIDPIKLEADIKELEGLWMKALPVLERANSMLPQQQSKPVQEQPQSLHLQAQQVQMQPRPIQQQTQPTPQYTPQIQQAQNPWVAYRPQQGPDPSMQSRPQQGQNSFIRWDPRQGPSPRMQPQLQQGQSSRNGNDGGAPPPPRQTYGLANSRFASPSFPGSSSSTGQHGASETNTVPKNAHGRNVNQQARTGVGRNGEHSQHQPMPQQDALDHQCQQENGRRGKKRGSGIMKKLEKERQRLEREQQKLEQKQQGEKG